MLKHLESLTKIKVVKLMLEILREFSMQPSTQMYSAIRRLKTKLLVNSWTHLRLTTLTLILESKAVIEPSL